MQNGTLSIGGCRYTGTARPRLTFLMRRAKKYLVIRGTIQKNPYNCETRRKRKCINRGLAVYAN